MWFVPLPLDKPLKDTDITAHEMGNQPQLQGGGQGPEPANMAWFSDLPPLRE